MAEDLVAELDQLQTTLENIANIFATYYWRLRLEGMPEELAAQMTIELHTMFWARELVPDYRADEQSEL